MPTTNRAMTFRVTARDNRSGGGGTASDDMVVTVNAASGPFVVTQPNTAVSWASASVQTVTWNVASTNGAPVNTANVKISLSTDGGFTYPIVLLASTANDGTESVTMPNVATTTARIKVEAVGNIFFDISDTNFSITATGAPGAFGKSAPSNGATGTSSTPTLIWGASSSATGYSVCVDTSDNGLCDTGAFVSVGNVTSWPVTGLFPAGLAPNTTYYWQVLATTATGTTYADGLSSTYWHFTTANVAGNSVFNAGWGRRPVGRLAACATPARCSMAARRSGPNRTSPITSTAPVAMESPAPIILTNRWIDSVSTRQTDRCSPQARRSQSKPRSGRLATAWTPSTSSTPEVLLPRRPGRSLEPSRRPQVADLESRR
jgi:hypothetical protein